MVWFNKEWDVCGMVYCGMVWCGVHGMVICYGICIVWYCILRCMMQ